MKMIKLSEKHYIVVDDSEIKKGDWFLSKENIIHNNYGWNYGDKKITHSTQPFEDVGLNTSMGCQLGFDKIEPLYLSEVNELLGVVDVEKKAQIEWGNVHRTGVLGYIDGYKQALEDNKHKKYTEEDMIKVIQMARKGYDEFGDNGFIRHGFDYAQKDVIQSLQPKTEWEVEFVDGKLKLKQ